MIVLRITRVWVVGACAYHLILVIYLQVFEDSKETFAKVSLVGGWGETP